MQSRGGRFLYRDDDTSPARFRPDLTASKTNIDVYAGSKDVTALLLPTRDRTQTEERFESLPSSSLPGQTATRSDGGQSTISSRTSNIWCIDHGNLLFVLYHLKPCYYLDVVACATHLHPNTKVLSDVVGSAIPATSPTSAGVGGPNWLIVTVAVLCISFLMLPLHGAIDSNLPKYLHVSTHQKLIAAYILGRS